MVPLTVGVTGHRDPDPADISPLRAAFGELLGSLAAAHPGVPLVVTTGMAAGADSLAADEAFERRIPVTAALAAPPDLFALDFPEEERGALRARVARCARVVTLTDGSDRQAGYMAVKAYLLRESRILVAFWDGDDVGKPGGTSDVVAARLNDGPAYQIVTPRKGRPRPAGACEVIALNAGT